MIDIHSHIIHEIDDGPSTIEESVKMAIEATKAGVDVIVATPHFQRDVFESGKIIGNYYKLLEKISSYGVTLLIGYEVFINPFVPDMIKNGKAFTLNNSEYILIELPFDSIPGYCFDTIFRLQRMNLTPIIAHPERYRNFMKNFDAFLTLVERGCLIQVDAASITGVYGKQIKEFAKKLIKLRMVHFVASDAHCAKDYADWYAKSYENVKSWVGEEYASILFKKNARAIVDSPVKDVYEML